MKDMCYNYKGSSLENQQVQAEAAICKQLKKENCVHTGQD